jgi:2,3-bisphosphoglycerate-dependent phosphoglycerate mutase
MAILALLRHGQSLWNLENRFTGWIDVPLTDQGRAEATAAGAVLGDLPFDVAYTSMLTRAQETLDLALAARAVRPPVIRDAQVKVWRRSYDIAPPNGESLEMTAKRTLPFYDRAIGGDLRQRKNVLVVAHGNSIRSIVMKLDALTPEQVVALELETGVPWVYDMSPEGAVRSKQVRKPR